MENNLKKRFAKLMSLALLTSVAVGSVPNIAMAEETNKLLNMPLSVESKEKILKNFQQEFKPNELLNKEEKENQEEVIRLIVEVDGLAAQDLVGKGNKVSAKESAIVEANQAPIRASVENIQGISLRHSYTNMFNGFSVEAKRKDIKEIEAIDGVKNVVEATKYELDMKSAKKMTKVYETWSKYSLKGEGMVVAVIDSGIDPSHEDLKNPKDSSRLKLKESDIESIKGSGALNIDTNVKTYFTEKVPFAYNYVDKNGEVRDLDDPTKPHGSHVSGIVGANGDEKLVDENKAAQGVAPEAQILLMKVFSNGPAGGAYDDDILAAIEDSVALNADVINMSLGSPNGFRNDLDPVQDAIKRATDAGVIVAKSAGNESSSTSPHNIGTLNDQSTAGNPGLPRDAFMVASVENDGYVQNQFEVKDDKGNVIFPISFKDNGDAACVNYKIQDIYNKNYEIVDGGLGNPEELNNVKGKIALIKRGGLTFGEKATNAQAKGAIGVIIYNKDGEGGVQGITTEGSPVKVPVVSISNKSGKEILKHNGKVIFNGKMTMNELLPSEIGGEMSDFSAWGPSPSLEFKPQISAPGGNIFSTFNKGHHGTIGGTSMATPHVAGAMTLIAQSIKEYAPEMKGRELSEYAKELAMNTAEVKIDKKDNIPYSPRRQGAGIIQTENAVRNRVTATHKGESSVALREIKDKKVTFTIDLKNHGDKDAVYTLGTIGGIMTQAKDVGVMIHDRELTDKEAKLQFSSDTVKVPAKGDAKFDVTLNIGDFDTEQFIEGFIKLESKDSNAPSLSIPYMGFYGDWGKESITTNNAWDSNKHVFIDILKEKGMYPGVLIENLALTGINNKDEILGLTGTNKDGSIIVDKNAIAISPNNDKLNDSIYPGLYSLRNSKQTSAEVIDKDGKVIRDLGNGGSVRKRLLGKNQYVPEGVTSLSWDGMVYNKEKGNYEKVNDGEYTYRVKLKVDYETAKEQVIDMPVKIDTVAPTAEITNIKQTGKDEAIVYFTANDDYSGVNMMDTVTVMVNGKVDVESTKAPVQYDKNSGLYYKTVKGLENNKVNLIEVGLFDNARNLGGTQSTILLGHVEPAGITFDDPKLDKKGLVELNANEYTVSGTINRPIKEMTLDGKRINLNIDEKGNVSFATKLELETGCYNMRFKAIDYDNKVIYDHGIKIICDSSAPIINLEEINIKDGKIKLNNGKINLKGNVADLGFGYTFYVNGKAYHKEEYNTITKPEKNKYDFEIELTDVNVGDVIEVKAVDLMENSTVINLEVCK